MVHFIGAGPGDPELITVRAKRLIETCPVVLYAGSLVPKEVVALARRYSIAVFCGALTPSEAVAAWESGADAVKIFPAEFFGPAYIKSLKGPFPRIEFLPTGGVTPETLEMTSRLIEKKLKDFGVEVRDEDLRLDGDVALLSAVLDELGAV